MRAGVGGDGCGVAGGCADVQMRGGATSKVRVGGVGFIRLVTGTTYCIGHKSSFPPNLSFKQIILGGGDASAILQLSRGRWRWEGVVVEELTGGGGSH